MTRKMQSCVDHIKTSIDVDPWAAEMVERVFTEYDARFDRVLEIINEMEHDISYTVLIVDGKANGVLCNSRDVKNRILALKGGDKE